MPYYSQYLKQYYQDNKEKRDEYNKKYYQTPKGKMSNRITVWKRRGIKIPEDYGENWKLFYDEEYTKTTHCELCFVELTEDKHNTPTRKCLDHDHDTGLFRNILCNTCNKKRG
tara:strand:- start:92 stop:430 length:339 start_codon:yes stop_codon:yes gene_type:complete